ncbi:Nn.00g084830.m01.CDS01 [Neocucurbitaria sp. VM-36]
MGDASTFPPLSREAAIAMLKRLYPSKTEEVPSFVDRLRKALEISERKLPTIGAAIDRSGDANVRLYNYVVKHEGMLALFLQGVMNNTLIIVLDECALVEGRNLNRAEKRAIKNLVKSFEELRMDSDVRWPEFRRRLETSAVRVGKDIRGDQVDSATPIIEQVDHTSWYWLDIMHYLRGQNQAERTVHTLAWVESSVPEAHTAYSRYCETSQQLQDYLMGSDMKWPLRDGSEAKPITHLNLVIGLTELLDRLCSLHDEYLAQKRKIEAQYRNHGERDKVDAIFEVCDKHVEIWKQETWFSRLCAACKMSSSAHKETASSVDLRHEEAQSRYLGPQDPRLVKHNSNNMTRVTFAENEQAMADNYWTRQVGGVLSASSLLRRCLESFNTFQIDNWTNLHPHTIGIETVHKDKRGEVDSPLAEFQNRLLETYNAYQHSKTEIVSYGSSIIAHVDGFEACKVVFEYRKRMLRQGYGTLSSMRSHFSMLLCVRFTQDRKEPGFLLLPTEMASVCPDITATHKDLREAIIDMHQILCRIMIDGGVEGKVRDLPKVTDEEDAHKRQLISEETSQKSTTDRFKKPLNKALELKDKLDRCVDVMKTYAEMVMDEDLAQEMAPYLNDNMRPILAILKRFETVLRVAGCEKPL